MIPNINETAVGTSSGARQPTTHLRGLEILLMDLLQCTAAGMAETYDRFRALCNQTHVFARARAIVRLQEVMGAVSILELVDVDSPGTLHKVHESKVHALKGFSNERLLMDAANVTAVRLKVEQNQLVARVG